MPENCCCGCCTLSSGAKIALTICAIEAVIGVLWYTELLMLLNDSTIFNPLQIIINVHTLEDFDVIHGLTLAGLGLNAFWFIAAIVAARGNITLSHGQLALWDIQTYLITLFDTGVTIYFTIKAQGVLAESQELYIKDMIPTKTLTYLVLLLVSSKGVIFLLLNIYFAHIVQMRGKQIDHDHSVLALYILQHIARCRAVSDVVPLQAAEAPPAYARSCPQNAPPSTISECRSDSNGSTWSLSYDAMKGMSVDLPAYTPYTNNGTLRPSIDMARELSRNPSCNSQVVNMQTTTETLLP